MASAILAPSSQRLLCIIVYLIVTFILIGFGVKSHKNILILMVALEYTLLAMTSNSKFDILTCICMHIS